MTYEYTANSNLVITLAEAKVQLRLESNFTDEDDLLTGYIKAATGIAERYCSRFILDTAVSMYLDTFPTDGAIQLYKGNVSGITEVTYLDDDSAAQTWASSKYDTDMVSIPARIFPKTNESYPSDDGSMNNVKVIYNVGWADAASVPEDIKIALKLIISQLYALREDGVFDMNSTARHYLNPYRLTYL